MAQQYHYTILSRSADGQEEEFKRWYREQHLPDVLKMPGVVSGQLFEVDFQKVYDLEGIPQWTLLTIYVLEGDDVEAIIESLKNESGSPRMPSTDSLNKSGMIQAAGRLIASGTAS